MASQVSSLREIGDIGVFLIQRISQFKAQVPRIGYYVFTKHLNSDEDLANNFLFSFDSQVYPTILAGTAQFVPNYTQYLITEFGLRILTENDYNIILE